MRLLAAVAMSVAFASLTIAAPAHAQSSSGIQSLITVSQIQADNANDDALDGANKQRDLVRQQQTLRDRQRALEDATPNQTVGAARVADAVVCGTCIVQSTSNDDEDD